MNFENITDNFTSVSILLFLVVHVHVEINHEHVQKKENRGLQYELPENSIHLNVREPVEKVQIVESAVVKCLHYLQAIYTTISR